MPRIAKLDIPVPKYRVGFVKQSRGKVEAGDLHDFVYDTVVRPHVGEWVDLKGEPYLIARIVWNIVIPEGGCDFDCIIMSKEEAEKYGTVV